MRGLSSTDCEKTSLRLGLATDAVQERQTQTSKGDLRSSKALFQSILSFSTASPEDLSSLKFQYLLKNATFPVSDGRLSVQSFECKASAVFRRAKFLAPREDKARWSPIQWTHPNKQAGLLVSRKR